MSCAYSSRNLTFPLSGLQALLLYKTQEEAESDCRQYGILVKDNTVMFSKETFQSNAHVSLLQSIQSNLNVTKFMSFCLVYQILTFLLHFYGNSR